MNIIEAPDMDYLWLRVNQALLWAKEDDLAYKSSLDTMIVDGFAHADSAAYSMNIGESLWLTPVRFTTMVRQYVNPTLLETWLEGCARIGTKGRGVNAMDMLGVKATVVQSNSRASRRKWGGCMRMVTYRAFPTPTISLFSRTSYLGYIGGLDLLVAHKLAGLVGDLIDVPVEDFAFNWHCDVWQFHGFKSMSYIFDTGQDKYLRGDRPKLEAKYPTWKLVRGWYQRLVRKDEEGQTYAEMSYSAERRIRRRMHAVLGEKRFGDPKNKPSDPLDVPIETLDLAAKLPGFRMPTDVEGEFEDDEED